MKLIAIIALFTLSLVTTLSGCTSANQGESGKRKSAKNERQEVQIVVKLQKTATIDSLLRSFSVYNLQPIQVLSAQDNMWYVSAQVANGYALVEKMRQNPMVEAAELSNVPMPANK